MAGETLDDQWAKLRETTFNVAESIISFKNGSPRDWFADNFPKIEPLIQERNLRHERWLSTGTRASKRKFYNAQRHLKQETRKLKNTWMSERAQEIQQAADTHDSKSSMTSLKNYTDLRRQARFQLQTKTSPCCSLSNRKDWNIGKSTCPNC